MSWIPLSWTSVAARSQGAGQPVKMQSPGRGRILSMESGDDLSVSVDLPSTSEAICVFACSPLAKEKTTYMQVADTMLSK